MNLYKVGLLLSLAVFAAVAPAQVQTGTEDQVVVGKLWKGSPGITETVAQIMQRKISIPKFPTVTKEEEEDEYMRGTLIDNPLSPAVSSWPPSERRYSGGSGGTGDSGGPYFSIGASWLGGQSSESGFVPPDTEGAVGPTQVLMCVNGRIKVFDKQGNLGALNASTNTFFASVRNNSTTSDPRVRFDRLTNRWFIVMINVSRPNRVMLAVSSGPTITSTSSFTFFQFTQDQVSPAGDTSALFDYPSLGVDANAVYIGGNMFGGSGVGSALFVVNKASILGAGPITVSVFRNVNGGSMNTPMGVDNDDPSPQFGYFIGTNPGQSGSLRLFRISNAGSTPTLSAPISITVPTTATASSTPALGSTSNLDAIDTRLYGGQIRTDRRTGVRTLWTSHHIKVNSSGVGTSTGDRTGGRWYQIGSVDTTPTLVQAGTVFDPSTSLERRWFASVVMNGQGHAFLGCSTAGPSRRPEVFGAYRVASDPLGTMPDQQTIQTTTFSYNAQTGGTQRWGDYSHTVVDPTDDMTMWSFQEYCNATNSWGIRIFQIKAPPPAAITTVNPNVLAPGNTYSLTVTGTPTNGSGYFDPGAGFPNHIASTISGPGVTVNSTTFNSPTQVTINVTVAANAALGPRDLTVTNPDGQSTTATGAITIATTEQAFPPLSFSIFRGIQVSGGLPEVLTSDDTYLRFQPGVTATSAESPIDVTFTGTSPVITPGTLKLRLETRASLGNVGQTVRLFNYQTNAFELVDTRTLTTSDVSNDIVVSTNAARFVRASDGQVQAQVRIKPIAPTSSFPYSVFIDQIGWLVAP